MTAVSGMSSALLSKRVLLLVFLAASQAALPAAALQQLVAERASSSLVASASERRGVPSRGSDKGQTAFAASPSRTVVEVHEVDATSVEAWKREARAATQESFGRRSHLEVAAIEEEMAILAMMTYEVEEKVQFGKWKAVEWTDTARKAAAGARQVGSDVAIIFQQEPGGACVLAFEGTNDNSDWLADANIVPKDLAVFGLKGYLAHAGFVAKLRDLFLSRAWSEQLHGRLADSCGELTVVGHSLGGGIAALFAAVVNNAYGKDLPFMLSDQGPALTISDVKVSRVYTFGAPGVTYGRRLQNALDADGAFEGARFFNVQDKGFDPIPCTPSINLVHPVMRAVMLLNRTGEVVMESYDPTSREAREWPSLGSMGTSRLPLRSEHSMEEYRLRIAGLFT